MSDMTRDEYMAALRATMRVKNPTDEQMLSICPHLTPEQALKGLMTGSGCIALPPLTVLGSFRTAVYYPGDPSDPGPVFFGGQYSRRGRASNPHADDDFVYVQEAMVYAERHWPEELIPDEWIDFRRILVQDPTDLTHGSSGDPRTKFVISIGLDRMSGELVIGRGKLVAKQWDDAIVIASVDPLVSAEFRGDRGSSIRTDFNCALCGGGLGVTACTACQTRFPDNGCRRGWDTSLSSKLIKLLRDNGHKFALDPERLLVD